jgi:arylsulfate sulfotransferase
MRFISLIILATIVVALPLSSHSSRPKIANATSVDAGSVTIVGQSAGPTPFIAMLQMIATPPSTLQSIRFQVTPRPGSVTRAVSATYFSDYLQGRGYLNLQTGAITLPVFGLYANYLNTVSLTYCFSDGTSQSGSVQITTGLFTDQCGNGTPTRIQARTNATTLSYDYMLVKSNCGASSPVIVDTDGALRWAGTSGSSTNASIFFNNGIYVASTPSGTQQDTALTRMELDGTFAQLKDYASIGMTRVGHHNIDPGKVGMLLECDTASQIESVILEVDASGNVLKRWDLADIISAAMTAGGDDPSQFVKPAPNDWFHNNAVTYHAADNTLVVSSRENFVIAIDYDSNAIKWILGDPTKQWYLFPSLRQYALTLVNGSLPPLGQHAISYTQDGGLLLFDDGKGSLEHTPAGADRTYSAPRKYQIDTQSKIATEVWNYPNGQAIYSPFCSSVYEDAALNYLIDYAYIQAAGGSGFTEGLVALDSSGAKIFDYRYPTNGCQTAWNSIPIHLENVLFTGNTTSVLRITSIVRNGANYLLSFPALAGKTYRLEYKAALSDPTWKKITDYSAGCSGVAQLTDTTAGGRLQRLYRVRLLP